MHVFLFCTLILLSWASAHQKGSIIPVEFEMQVNFEKGVLTRSLNRALLPRFKENSETLLPLTHYFDAVDHMSEHFSDNMFKIIMKVDGRRSKPFQLFDGHERPGDAVKTLTSISIIMNVFDDVVTKVKYIPTYHYTEENLLTKDNMHVVLYYEYVRERDHTKDSVTIVLTMFTSMISIFYLAYSFNKHVLNRDKGRQVLGGNMVTTRDEEPVSASVERTRIITDAIELEEII
ncbi:hypothetical protein PCE1_004914 [Barthelona sp. PCE]